MMLIQTSVCMMLKIVYRIRINILLDNINSKYDLMDMNSKDFKFVMASVFKRKGYNVRICDRIGEGEGCLLLNGIQYVQIKRYSFSHLLEIEEAKKLVKHMQDDSIYRGMIISIGDFKNNTKKYCHTNVIKCINGDELLAMCKEVQNISDNIALERIGK